MPKLPFMKFYPSDFLLAVQTLGLEETGAWIKLISHIWIHSDSGTIRLSDKELSHLFGLDVNQSGKILNLLWTRGILDNERSVINATDDNIDHNNVINNITCRRISRDKKCLKMNALYVSKVRVRSVSGSCKENVRYKKSEVRSQKLDKDKDIRLLSTKVDELEYSGPTPEDLMNLWNEQAHSNLPRVEVMTPKRKSHIMTRLKENPSREFWEDILKKINSSHFLTGTNGNTWKCNFDWIINASNLTKILEGNYDNTKNYR